jgi:ribosomal protein S2
MYSEIKKMVYLPQLIFLTNKNKSAIHESTLLNIPCMIVENNQKDQKMLYVIQGIQNNI